MRLGIRVFFGFFLVTGLAAFFVMRLFVNEVKPSVRQVMEDMMVDTANILAELASEDLVANTLAKGRFATQVSRYASRPINAQIWGMDKQSLDFRIYVTDVRGTVLYDSYGTAAGKDFSQWRDVVLTLRGEYGARSTREVAGDSTSSVLHVAAPIMHGTQVVGVLTVAKPVSTIQVFIDRAEHKILRQGAWLLALSVLIGAAVTLWVVWSIRKLRRYANAVELGNDVPVPRISGELGELALAMDAMRQRVQARDSIEAYVQALTHELKSPLAALQASAELLQEDLPPADSQRFAAQIMVQSQRLNELVAQLLELSKLEQQGQRQVQRQGQGQGQPQARARAHTSTSSAAQRQATDIHAFATQHAQPWLAANAPQLQLATHFTHTLQRPVNRALLALALSNVLDNAAAFSPAGSTLTVGGDAQSLWVLDAGPGMPDFALARAGERFFSTIKPHGAQAQRKGSGLGLAIVAQIMRLHHGELRFENTASGLKVRLVFAV
jgi:two-component system, OmpR family, sensor histidine kinase CreC